MGNNSLWKSYIWEGIDEKEVFHKLKPGVVGLLIGGVSEVIKVSS